MRFSAKPVLFIVISVIMIALAAALDSVVAGHVSSSGAESFLRGHVMIRDTLKAPGNYLFTIVVALFVAWRHRWELTQAVFLLIATSAAISNTPIQWMVGRARPFTTLSGDSHLLTPFEFHPFPAFTTKNWCFPSGHATLAFATAAALGILWPRWRWGFYPVALIVAAERVLENAHWLSDTVAAAALGVGCVWVVRRLIWDNKNWGKRNDERDTISVAGHSRV